MDGFSTLRVQFTSPLGAINSTHSIYCKVHRVRHSSNLTPNDRTLFTVGWPPYCTKRVVEELFSRAGHVIDCFLQPNAGVVVEENAKVDRPNLPGRFQVMYISFSQRILA